MPGEDALLRMFDPFGIDVSMQPVTREAGFEGSAVSLRPMEMHHPVRIPLSPARVGMRDSFYLRLSVCIGGE